MFAIAIVGGAFVFMFASLVIVGTLALFLALLIRTNLLYIMVVIGPIMLAGIPWRATQKWAVRWLSIVVALIFTKLGVVIVMAVGSGALTSSLVGGFDGEAGEATDVLGLMGQFLGAGVMLIVAALTPVATFAFFDFLGENAVGALHADARRPIDTAKQTATRHLSPSMLSGHSTPSTPVATQAAQQPGQSAAADNTLLHRRLILLRIKGRCPLQSRAGSLVSRTPPPHGGAPPERTVVLHRRRQMVASPDPHGPTMVGRRQIQAPP